MSTNRKRTPRSRKHSPLTPGERAWLFDECQPNAPWEGWTDYFFLDDEDLKSIWTRNREEVLSTWVSKQPCTRPSLWWKYDAPKEHVNGFGDRNKDRWPVHYECYGLQAHRQRLGGTGTPAHEVLNVVPSFTLGIPTFWDFFRSEMLVPIDPDDPPKFESQAAYLQRHGLLTTAEERHLQKHPELLDPEILQPKEAP